jgi:hypothetical protein
MTTIQLSTVFGNVNCYSSREDGTTFDVFGQLGLELLAVNGCNDGPYFEGTFTIDADKWDKLNDKCIKVADCNLYRFIDDLDDANDSLSIDSTDTDVPHNYGAWSAWVIPANSGNALYLRVKAELRKIKAEKKAAKKAAKAERTFQDLDADAQRRAIDDCRENVRQSDELDLNSEMLMEELDNQFFDVSDLKYQGFWSQGDGASFQYETTEDLWAAWVHLQNYSARETYCLLGWGHAIVKGARTGSRYVHENSIRPDLDISHFYDLESRGYSQIFDFVTNEAKKFQVSVGDTAIELMQDIYRELESEYEYQMSDECIGEYLQNSGDYFTKRGNMK